MDRAEFIATFPGIQSAITFHGSGGMQIRLDIPENQVGEGAKLLMWRELPLHITVEPVEAREIALTSLDLGDME